MIESDRRLDELSCARLLGNVAELVHAAQKAGQPLGTVTPASIVVSPDGSAKLAPGAASLRYTAPERLRPSLPAEGPLRRLGGRVLRRVQLRESPAGSPLRTLGRRTGLDGPQILAIVARRGRWYGVLHPSLPNSKAGWIPVDAVELLREH